MPGSPLTVVAIILLIILVIVVLAALVILLVPRLIFELRLRSRARHDYRVARGTQHLKQLEEALSKLERDIKRTKESVEKAERKLNQLDRKRVEDLRHALCRYLVKDRLTEADGIGPQLSRRIVRLCFRGNLRDLLYAQRYVRGIGHTRQSAIQRWVYDREREFPRLMEGPFPGKEQVQKRHRARMEPVERQLDEARAALTEKKTLYKPVKIAVRHLRWVDVSDFRKALRSSGSNHSVPNWYLEGIYPSWESPPDWFVDVLSRYGG